jgi:shikimate kinase
MSTARPLLASVNPRATFKALLDARAPLYREVATVEIDTSRRSPNQVARAVLEALGEQTGPAEPGEPGDREATRDEPLLPDPTFGPPSEVTVAVGDNDDRRR